jgi:NADH:ubiquinone oxidoreductase subunit
MAATTGTRLFTLFRGKLVGHDEFGNRYYEARGKAAAGQRKRRWVVYKGIAEPSKVPSQWHGWLHHTLDAPLSDKVAKRFKWQKPHLPNLTGTQGRYLPPGHLLKGGARAANEADYQAWKPE